MDGRILRQKGVEHALDHMCDSLDSVASGIGEWLHNGRGHSYPAGHRHCRGTDPGDSGTESIVAIWTLAGEGEVFKKEVVNRSRKIFPKFTIPSEEEVSQPIIPQQTYRQE